MFSNAAQCNDVEKVGFLENGFYSLNCRWGLRKLFCAWVKTPRVLGLFWNFPLRISTLLRRVLMQILHALFVNQILLGEIEWWLLCNRFFYVLQKFRLIPDRKSWNWLVIRNARCEVLVLSTTENKFFHQEYVHNIRIHYKRTKNKKCCLFLRLRRQILIGLSSFKISLASLPWWRFQ